MKRERKGKVFLNLNSSSGSKIFIPLLGIYGLTGMGGLNMLSIYRVERDNAHDFREVILLLL